MVQRIFLVNGASKGIGLAISKRLAAAGHHVVGIAREPLPSFPGTLVSVDLRDDKASAEAFVELAQRSCREAPSHRRPKRLAGPAVAPASALICERM